MRESSRIKAKVCVFECFRAARNTFEFVRNGDAYGRLLSIIPWIVKIFPNLSGYNKLKREAAGQYEFMKNLIDEQFSTYAENHERHFLDLYFKEMKTENRNKHFRHADFDCMRIHLCIEFVGKNNLFFSSKQTIN